MTHAHTSIADAVILLKASKKFQNWGKLLRREDIQDPAFGVADPHFTPQQLADAWGVDVETIRNIFRDEPGVLKIGEKNPRHKRQYLTLRIPKDVAERVHARLSE